ncbi:Hypothetical protein CINCED_3A010499 [Cinara cedri]|uniref:Uncharacterized protein n=1 Tax=Cinara cedri TaxID=506608 RepID=A0A5E4MJ95_9HEMI|nr:Hypothetical protein CINCED_3A010499 [Cinara cedri]
MEPLVRWRDSSTGGNGTAAPGRRIRSACFTVTLLVRLKVWHSDCGDWLPPDGAFVQPH